MDIGSVGGFDTGDKRVLVRIVDHEGFGFTTTVQYMQRSPLDTLVLIFRTSRLLVLILLRVVVQAGGSFSTHIELFLTANNPC